MPQVTYTFKVEVPDAVVLSDRLQRLIALNQKAVLAATKMGDAGVVERLVQRGKKITTNNFVRVLVAIALNLKVSDTELLDKIDQTGIKTGRPASAR